MMRVNLSTFGVCVWLLVQIFSVDSLQSSMSIQSSPVPKRHGSVHKKAAALQRHQNEPDAEDETDEADEPSDAETEADEPSEGETEKDEPSEDETSEEHGEHEEEGHGEHEVGSIHTASAHTGESDTTDAVAVMLMAMSIFQISLFYMVNAPDKTISGFTWQMLSSAISIFTAILIWTSISNVAMYVGTGAESDVEARLTRGWHVQVLNRRVKHEHEALEVDVLLVTFLIMFCLYHLVLNSCIWKYTTALEAFSTLGAHTLGFAAVQLLGTIAEEGEIWDSSWVNMAGFSFLSLLALLLLNVLTSIVRTLVFNHLLGKKDDEHDHELLHKWMHINAEAENEFAAFAIGLLITLTIQQAITGEPVPYHGNPYGKTKTEVELMYVASLVCFVLMVIITVSDERLTKLINSEYWERFARMIVDSTAFVFGWCFLFSCRCLYWCSTNDEGFFKGDQMTARIIQALVLSFVTIFVIIMMKLLSVKYIVDVHGVQAMMNGFGLMLGLSWEGAYYNAIEDIAEATHSDAFHDAMEGVGMSLCVCVVVLPAWYLFVFPHALESHEYEHGKKHGKALEEESAPAAS